MNTTTQRLQQCLAEARFEVLPLRGVVERVAALPGTATVTVTSSPGKGPHATVALATELAGLGFHVVPHLAARSIADRGQLSALLEEITDAGLWDVFVVAGDSSEPAGEFADALGLLRAMDELGRRPDRVGITGYPERHTAIPDQVTIRAMGEKSRYADYIVSQICYDADTTARWISEVRQRGVTLPLHIGVPGVLETNKLLRISLKIGLGQSMRFLRKQHGMVSKLLSSYTPQQLLDELASQVGDPDLGIAGWHFFTFNEIATTLSFRDQMIARLQEVPA